MSSRLSSSSVARCRVDPVAQGARVTVLAQHRAPHDDEAGPRARRDQDRERVDEDVEALQRIEPRHRTHHGNIVGETDPRPERARVRGRELVRVEVLVEHDDVRGIELRTHGVRHGNDTIGEVTAEEPFDSQRER